jgi:hypothetical protein
MVKANVATNVIGARRLFILMVPVYSATVLPRAAVLFRREHAVLINGRAL